VFFVFTTLSAKGVGGVWPNCKHDTEQFYSRSNFVATQATQNSTNNYTTNYTLH